MPVWTVEFEDPLFSIAFHPEKKEFVAGFASGRVTAYKYDYDSEPTETWTTKRHKSSCRGVAYTQDGQYILTIGSDNVIKKADSSSGKVVKKAELSFLPSTFKVNSHYIYIGDEQGSLIVLNLDLKETHKFENVVPDCVNSISCMEYKNQYNVIVTGMSKLVHIDIRKGVRTTSEDQEDELLCGTTPNEKQSVFGMSEGVLTFWVNDDLADQQNRLRLSKDGTVDSIVSGETDETIIAGTSEGKLFEVDTHACKIVNTLTHAPESMGEEVSLLDWDCDWHLVSGSMGKLVLWSKGEEDPKPEEPEHKEAKSNKRKNKSKNKNKKGQQAKRSKMFADL